MQIDEILGRFSEVSEEHDGYLAACSAHADSRPSLRIWVGENRKVRLNCRAGCTPAEVVSAAGLVWTDLFDVSGDAVTAPAERPGVVGTGMVAGLRGWLDTLSLSDDAAEYARRRFGLETDDSVELGLRSTSPGGDTYQYAGSAFARYPRLVVPLYGFDGIARGAQGRDISGECPSRWVSLSNPQGARWIPFGVLRGQGGYGATIVSEGPGDGLTATALGYDAVMIRGAYLAGNPTLLADLAAGLRGQLVIAGGDNDEAGLRFNRALAEGLRPYGIDVHALRIPDHGPKTDITRWREADPEGFAGPFHAAVKAAEPVAPPRDSVRVAADAAVSAATGAAAVSADDGHEAARILAELLARYGDTDAGNAHALVAWTDGRIRYASGLGFYVWDGRVWEASAMRVRQEIHRMAAALMLAGKIREAKPFATTSRIDDLMTELRAVPAVNVSVDAFDARPDLLSFANGTVELRTGRLREHRKEDLLTYCLDVDYVPTAKAPRWERFLTEIFPDNPDLPAYMQRLTGYGITGSAEQQCFAVLWGNGANGKSIYTDTLSTIFGAVSQTTPFATFEEKASGGIPNDIAALRGARLVMASEGESGKPMSEGTLKRATGGDKMTARFMRQEFFTFTPTFLIMLATNFKPQFRGQDDGLWRRVKLIEFNRYFAPSERDYELSAKLLREAEGIAAWAVAGAVEWYAHGLQDPESIRAATSEYKATSDALADFFPGIIVRDPFARMLGADVYHAYRDWCEAEGLKSTEVWSRRALYSALAERKISKRRSAEGQVLLGIRLADQTSPPVGPGIFSKEA